MKSAALIMACLSCTPAYAQGQISLAWPVECRLGETCEIQHYVDHGHDATAQDYRCGTVTYPGHNGTDIRLPTMADQLRGVNVLAVAPGRVLRTRDDMADVSVRAIGHDALKDRDCGNGLVIAHADGFESQYCHLAHGSLRVRPGDSVTTGQPLGHVGLSGNTEFPHLHITVRHNGTVIDPFAYGEPQGACTGGTSLWATGQGSPLPYKAGTVLNAGLAPRQVSMADIEAGLSQEVLSPGSAAVFAYVRAINLRRGDVQRLVVTGPNGSLADYTEPALPSNKDQWFMGAGRKRPATGWPTGPYSATYTMTRDNRVTVEKRFSAELTSEPHQNQPLQPGR